MPENIETIVEGEYAFVRALNGKHGQLAGRLIAAARPQTHLVQTSTGRSSLSFRVPVKVAHAAGVIDQADEAPADADTPDEESNENEKVDGDELDVEEPPRAGRGSGEEAWRRFLTAQGIDAPEDANRDALIELWDSREQ